MKAGRETELRLTTIEHFVPPSGRAVYWGLVGAALFALIPLDFLLTTIAVAKVGVSHEANPLARWALIEGFHVYLLSKIATGTVVFLLFAALSQYMKDLSKGSRRKFARIVTVYLFSLIIVGAVVVINNLGVILSGESLITF